MISFGPIGKSKRGLAQKKKNQLVEANTSLKSVGVKEKYTNQGSQMVETLGHRKVPQYFE